MSPELGVPAVNRTDVIEFDFSAQIFLKPFEQEPTAAEQLTRALRRALATLGYVWGALTRFRVGQLESDS